MINCTYLLIKLGTPPLKLGGILKIFNLNLQYPYFLGVNFINNIKRINFTLKLRG